MSTVGPLPQEFLSFRVGAQEYGLPILEVQEIRSCEAAVRLPRSEAQVLGVLDLRGRIVPIFDAAVLLGRLEAAPAVTAVNIICRHTDQLVGLRVDEVLDVVALDADSIRALPGSLSGRHSGGPRAMGCQGDRRLLLTSMADLLQDSVRPAPSPSLLLGA